MKFILFLILFLKFITLQAIAFTPYSGISCHNIDAKNNVEFFFKQDEDYIYATAYKRVKGKFVKVGNVVGQKVSSFILFEDDTVDENLNFAWHLDMVTKILKPFVLTEVRNNNLDLPSRLDCISKNFWF